MNDNSYNSDPLYVTNNNIVVANVDDSLSFSQAFAEARNQVGSGGVFEWRGNVYGTYYADEWNSMTATQQSNWQSQINYREVYEIAAEYDADRAMVRTYPASGEVDGELHVLNVYFECDYDGNFTSYIAVECNGEYGYIIDVDNDNVIDYVAQDLNGDGVVTEDEYIAVEDPQITTADLFTDYVIDSAINGEIATAEDLETGEVYELSMNNDGGFDLNTLEDPNYYTAQNEDLPDYTNEANADEWLA